MNPPPPPPPPPPPHDQATAPSAPLHEEIPQLAQEEDEEEEEEEEEEDEEDRAAGHQAQGVVPPLEIHGGHQPPAQDVASQPEDASVALIILLVGLAGLCCICSGVLLWWSKIGDVLKKKIIGVSIIVVAFFCGLVRSCRNRARFRETISAVLRGALYIHVPVIATLVVDFWQDDRFKGWFLLFAIYTLVFAMMAANKQNDAGLTDAFMAIGVGGFGSQPSLVWRVGIVGLVLVVKPVFLVLIGRTTNETFRRMEPRLTLQQQQQQQQRPSPPQVGGIPLDWFLSFLYLLIMLFSLASGYFLWSSKHVFPAIKLWMIHPYIHKKKALHRKKPSDGQKIRAGIGFTAASAVGVLAVFLVIKAFERWASDCCKKTMREVLKNVWEIHLPVIATLATNFGDRDTNMTVFLILYAYTALFTMLAALKWQEGFKPIDTIIEIIIAIALTVLVTKIHWGWKIGIIACVLILKGMGPWLNRIARNRALRWVAEVGVIGAG